MHILSRCCLALVPILASDGRSAQIASLTPIPFASRVAAIVWRYVFLSDLSSFFLFALAITTITIYYDALSAIIKKKRKKKRRRRKVIESKAAAVQDFVHTTVRASFAFLLLCLVRFPSIVVVSLTSRCTCNQLSGSCSH